MSTAQMDHPDSPLENISMRKLRATLPIHEHEQDTTSLNDLSANGDHFSRAAALHSNINSRGHGKCFSTNGDNSSRSVAHSTTNRASRRSSSRRRSSFASSFRHQAAAESTTQVDAKFFAFMDMMANASREAVTLKELWSRTASERRDFSAEREELLEQIEEVTTQLETTRNEHSRHENDLGEHKSNLRTMAAELSAAISGLSIERNKIADRDQHIDRLRNELISVQELSANFRVQVERLRTESHSTETLLKAMEDERDGAKQDSERYQRELHKAMHERVEITTRFDEATSSLESLRKEALLSTERLRKYELDQDEKLHEIARLKEELRKSRGREEESSQELHLTSEKYTQSTREATKLRDSVRDLESERDELVHTVDVKNREIKLVVSRHGETETLLAERTSTLDRLRRELSTMEERLRSAELERDDHHEALKHTREQQRLVVISRNELEDELVTARGKADASHRQVNLSAGALHRTEQTLTEVRLEVSTLFDTIKHLEREKMDWQKKNGGLSDEVMELKGSIVILRSELHTAGEMRDGLQDELRHSREELEEVMETITTTHDDSDELQFELESMRTLLRESREQKELAISARAAADRERDEANMKYEEKCRELERFEESAASRYHAHSSGGTKVSTTTKRMTSRGSTTG